MSIEDYKQAGYLMSTNIPQAVIDRAEKDVLKAYIYPVMPDADTTAEGVARDALMSLAELLVKQRSIVATRAGAKEKNTPQSYTPDAWAILRHAAKDCALNMQMLANAAGVCYWEDKVTDICNILYRTNFIGK